MFLRLSWLLFVTSFVSAEDYELNKVLVFSRHNIRSSLNNNYQPYTPKQPPIWSNKHGELTEKGQLLEKIMGKYFSLWLQDNKLTLDCPKDVNIYTNSYQRTIASGHAFANGFAPDCDLVIHHKNLSEVDSIFSLNSRNLTPEFNEKFQAYVKNKLSKVDLRDSFDLLQNIIDIKESSKCKDEGVCDLLSVEHSAEIVDYDNPQLYGPIAIGNSLADTFMMQYYDGFDLTDVAWGLIKNEEEWKKLLEINRVYHDIIFNETDIARDVNLPLVRLLSDVLLNNNTKFTYLVGHDGNIFTISTILAFKWYELPDQYEKTPVGGKLVFQKWFDKRNDTFLLKLEYVYASTKQMRDSEELSLSNPPKRVVLEMDGCPIDNNGFCLWNDFEKKVEKI